MKNLKQYHIRTNRLFVVCLICRDLVSIVSQLWDYYRCRDGLSVVALVSKEDDA